jgi:hypothetical protein
MSNKDYVLYLVMSTSCQHCVKLKTSQLPKIEAAISALGNVGIEKIELASMGDKLPQYCPSSLSLFVKWYPTFVLTSREEISKSKISGLPIKASVFNGDFVDNKLSYKNEFPMNDTGISDWCQREIAKYGNNLTKKKISNETENLLIPTTVCSKKYRPRNN